jgi:hypothetical protein
MYIHIIITPIAEVGKDRQENWNLVYVAFAAWEKELGIFALVRVR